MSYELQKFYTVSEVAEALRVTRQTIWRRVRFGHMPPLQKAGGYGRKSGYPAETLARLIQGDANE